MIVETARLVLRPFAPDDIEAYARFRAKPGVGKFLIGGDGLDHDTALLLARDIVPLFVGEWQKRGYGPWAVIDRGNGAFLGHAGLRYLPDFGESEILYALDPDVWGRGLATEAAAAARDIAFDRLGLAKVMAIALPANLASIRVMTKAGLSYRRMVKFKGYDVAYHDLAREDRPQASARNAR